MLIVLYIILTFIIVTLSLMILASINATLGFRSQYVKALLNIFEFGRGRIERREKHLRNKRRYLDDTPTIEYNDYHDHDEYIDNSVISRTEHSVGPLPSQLAPTCIPRNRSYNTLQREFDMWDIADFVKSGVEAVIEDEVTKRFSAEENNFKYLTESQGIEILQAFHESCPEAAKSPQSCQCLLELPSWNLLTRTNKNYAFISLRLSVLWGVGCILRYCVLLPLRIIITIFGVGWLVLCTAAIGCIPEGRFKEMLYWHTSLMCFRILARAFSAIVTYHNRENRAKGGGICVANHTSPIDVVILACDNCYALVGQRQGGFLGVLQRALARAATHVWFERFEMKDRALVTQRLKEHCSDPKKLPILIFPEGTCINNTSVMMFKKGSFEVGDVIYPASIKYDSKFGDPFWNSSKHGYMHYLLMMMSSWAIVCEVWYLPPMHKLPNESAINFAKRVKAEIARQGGLIDLEWDGQLKRVQVKKEWKEMQQQEYSRKIRVD